MKIKFNIEIESLNKSQTEMKHKIYKAQEIKLEFRNKPDQQIG